MKKKLHFSLLSFLIIVIIQLGCDNYTHNSYVNTDPANYIIITMNKAIGGPDMDWGTGIISTEDNGYIAIGTTESWGLDSNSLYIVSVDSNGVFDWQNFYGGRGNDYGEDLIQTPSGDIVIVGTSSSFELATGIKWDPAAHSFIEWDYNFYLVKINSDGFTYWEKVFGTDSTSDWGKSMATSSDGFVLAGYQDISSEKTNAFVVKSDFDGNLIWQNSYETSNNGYAYSITETNDGGYIIAGYTLESQTTTANPYIFKISSSGDLVWENTYGTPGRNERLFSVIGTSDDGFVAVGFSSESSEIDPSSSTLYALKINSAGSVIWENLYPQSNLAQGKSIIENPDGSLVVSGVGYQMNNVILTKLNSSGTFFWTQSTPVLGTGNGLVSIDGGYGLTGSLTSLANLGISDLLIMEIYEDFTNIEL